MRRLKMILQLDVQNQDKNSSTFILPTSSRLPWVFATSVDNKKSEEN